MPQGIVPVSFEAMEGLLREHPAYDSTLPGDARIVWVMLDRDPRQSRRCLYLVCESTSFPPTPEGQALPEVSVMLTRRDAS